MNKLLESALIISVGVLLQSCITQQKCNDRYPPLTKDSVYVVESWCYDTVLVPMPYEELSFDTSGVVPNSLEFHHKQKKGHLTQTLDIKNGVIKQDCQEEAYQDTVMALRKNIREFKLLSSVSKPIVAYKTEWYDMLFRWWFLITALLLIGGVGWKILSPKF